MPKTITITSCNECPISEETTARGVLYCPRTAHEWKSYMEEGEKINELCPLEDAPA